MLTHYRALPILRQLGAQGGGSMIRGGDFSMLKVWVGLEARSFLQASIDTVSFSSIPSQCIANQRQVERCVKYDQLSPNI